MYPSPPAKTGQTTSYASSDDGDLKTGVSSPVPRFSVQSNTNVVLDNLTGLMWTRNANLFGKQNRNNAIAMCKNLTYGDYSDWRLPTVRELFRLLDFQNSFPSLPTGHPFTGVQDYDYWTSTTVPTDMSHAFVVGIHYGGVNSIYLKTATVYPWPFREDSEKLETLHLNQRFEATRLRRLPRTKVQKLHALGFRVFVLLIFFFFRAPVRILPSRRHCLTLLSLIRKIERSKNPARRERGLCFLNLTGKNLQPKNQGKRRMFKKKIEKILQVCYKIVVNTHNWLSGKKVLISPTWIDSIDWAEKKVKVDLPREKIKDSPEYDPSDLVNREYDVRLYDFYGRPKYWE
ncbi:MAG: DUF1566 domain-containing protein [Kiritimatiellae bacterium]|nr:DUF1566 domain-containing protein [Kiritimatiellia bacterium]